MAPPGEPPTSITLRVKVPPGTIPGGVDEFTLGTQVPVSARIGQVRDRIQKTLPSSPTPERQRLLYGGRALVDNEQKLADALNIKRDPTQQEYVMHLLVKDEVSSTTSSAPRVRASTPTRSESPAQSQGNAPPVSNQQLHPHAQPHIPHNLTHQNIANPVVGVGPFQGVHGHMHMNTINQPRVQQAPGFAAFGMPPHFGQNMPIQFPPPQGVHAAGLPRPAHPLHGSHEQAHNTPAQDGSSSTDRVSRDLPDQERTEQSRQDPNNLDGLHNRLAGQHQTPLRPMSNQGFHMEGIGPNGERITVHQQTMNFPHTALPNTFINSPSHYPQVPLFPGPFPGMQPQLNPRQTATPALDQARNNIADIRRRLEILRTAHNTGSGENADTPSLNEEVAQIERRMQALNDYLDPLRLSSGSSSSIRTASPRPAGNERTGQLPFNIPHLPNVGWQQRAHGLRQQQHEPSGSTADVTCYLLSSPTGPQAILYSSQHGTFHGAAPNITSQATPGDLHPTSTTGNPGANNPQAEERGAQVPAGAMQAAQPQVQAVQQDPMGPFAPIMNNIWLLLRILIFSYFLLGANMGWRRPLALLAIGLGFWMIRMGLLAEGAAIRRWWDGIMNENQPRAQNRQGQAEQQDNGQGQQQQDAQQRRRPGQMPTPEQLAQRLLDEDARARNNRIQRVRNYIRPIERAAALLVASLWPGVGEAYVRAREEEERQRAEEEIEARRREEEERQRKEEDDKEKADETSSAAELTSPEPKAAPESDPSEQPIVAAEGPS